VEPNSFRNRKTERKKRCGEEEEEQSLRGDRRCAGGGDKKSVSAVGKKKISGGREGGVLQCVWKSWKKRVGNNSKESFGRDGKSRVQRGRLGGGTPSISALVFQRKRNIHTEKCVDRLFMSEGEGRRTLREGKKSSLDELWSPDSACKVIFARERILGLREGKNDRIWMMLKTPQRQHKSNKDRIRGRGKKARRNVASVRQKSEPTRVG